MIQSLRSHACGPTGVMRGQRFARSPLKSSAQVPSAPVEHRKTSEPYTGDLSIFDSPGRDQRLQINRVMDILGIASGKTVADIGAGSGWFTVRAARRVGESGVVYAVDINPESIRYIDDRAQKEKIAQCKNHPRQSRQPAAARDSVDCRAVAEDLSRSCRTGCAAGKPARRRCAPGPKLESSTATEMAKTMAWVATSSFARPRRQATVCSSNMIS